MEVSKETLPPLANVQLILPSIIGLLTGEVEVMLKKSLRGKKILAKVIPNEDCYIY